MQVAVPPLIEVVAAVPAVRARRGIRHPQVALLGLAGLAMLCGRSSYKEIAAWGRSSGRANRPLLEALGFTHPNLPGAVTFSVLFRRLAGDDRERRLGAWAASIGAVTAAAAPAAGDGIAIDGKPLRGSKRAGATGAHRLSAVSHRLQQTLGQVAVDANTNELPLAPARLAKLVRTGKVVTMDALLTQREIAETVLAGGGDDVMIGKGNQPTREDAISTVFTTPPSATSRPGGRPPPRITGTGGSRPAPEPSSRSTRPWRASSTGRAPVRSSRCSDGWCRRRPA